MKKYEAVIYARLAVALTDIGFLNEIFPKGGTDRQKANFMKVKRKVRIERRLDLRVGPKKTTRNTLG
jgi:hypothetical protein